MRHVKSAPSNLCQMVNRKIDNSKKENKNLILPILNNETKIQSLQKKIKLKDTVTGIISDSFSETNKYIPETDNYFYSLSIETFNNFIINKLNKENIQRFLLTLITRLFFSQIYHTVLINFKENIKLYLH